LCRCVLFVIFDSTMAVTRHTFWELDVEDDALTGCRGRSFSDSDIVVPVDRVGCCDVETGLTWKYVDFDSADEDTVSQCSTGTVTLMDESDESDDCEFISDDDCSSRGEPSWILMEDVVGSDSSPTNFEWRSAASTVLVPSSAPFATASVGDWVCSQPFKQKRRGCRGGRSRRICHGAGKAVSGVQEGCAISDRKSEEQYREPMLISTEMSSNDGIVEAASPAWYETLIFKNTMSNTRYFDVCELLNAEAFDGQYNLVYMPANFRTMNSFGFVFVNFTDHVVAKRALTRFHGFEWTHGKTSAVLEVEWSTHQGLDILIDRFRNCPVMHDLVPREFKPLLLEDGLEVEFPHPTTAPPAPRQFRQ